MDKLLLVLGMLISLVLIVMVLLQSSKGGGLAGTFGGAGVSNMFGTRRTADFLSKATWYLAAALVLLTLVINLFVLRAPSTENVETPQVEQPAQDQPQQ